MPDAHSEMLELAVRLAGREAAGHRLSSPEQSVADILWIGTQVSPNGFDGWLAYTSCQRMERTLSALSATGCHEVAALARQALAVAGVEPSRMTDAERLARVDGMTEDDRGKLAEVDRVFYEAYPRAMDRCRRYAEQNGLLGSSKG